MNRIKSLGKKKIIIITGLILVVVLALGAVIANNMRISKIENNAEEWKNTAILLPESGKLMGAGHITITWKPADVMGSVDEYVIYVNDEVVDTVDGDTTTYEYYSTKVEAHTVYVKAKLNFGSEINSDITTFYVNKKGFCLNKDMAYAVEADKWGTSWYYNWDFQAFKFDSFQHMEYVPMMWTTYDTDPKNIARFPGFGYKHVLAYNEPDLFGQADIDVETAIEGMHDFMDQDLYVGSPATARCPPWSKTWFQPFMERMEEEGMDVDFIAFHHYWNWYTEEGAYAFLDLIDETWEMYHKPIWITEFALTGVPFDIPDARKSVYDYMSIVLPELDKREYVERYAWFPFKSTDPKSGASALLNFYTGEVFELGKLYQELGMPEGYEYNSGIKPEDNPEKDTIK